MPIFTFFELLRTPSWTPISVLHCTGHLCVTARTAQLPTDK